MKPIQIFRSLPIDYLPASARVDFLHLIACNKPAIRTKLFDPTIKLSLEDWCNRYGFILRVDSEYFACIAREIRVAEQILELDQSQNSHERLLGLLLGYPECCSNFIESVGESNIDSIEKEVINWKFSGDFTRINPSKYLNGASLICHIPCSINCQSSLNLANQALNFINQYRNETCLAPWLIW